MPRLESQRQGPCIDRRSRGQAQGHESCSRGASRPRPGLEDYISDLLAAEGKLLMFSVCHGTEHLAHPVAIAMYNYRTLLLTAARTIGAL